MTVGSAHLLNVFAPLFTPSTEQPSLQVHSATSSEILAGYVPPARLVSRISLLKFAARRLLRLGATRTCALPGGAYWTIFFKISNMFPSKIFANGRGDEGPAARFAKVIRKVTPPECPPDLGTARPTNRGYRGAVVYSTAGAGVQAFNLTPAAGPTPERETRVGRKGKANSQSIHLPQASLATPPAFAE